MSRGAGILTETPWWLEVNGTNVAAGTVRPPALREMACGRLRTDGWILAREELLDLQVEELREGIAIRAQVPEPRAAEALAEQGHRRVTGCGALHVVRCAPGLVRHARVAALPDPGQFRELFRALFAAADQSSPIGGVHVAALVEDGTMGAAFADVSRHNTVDKAIGYALLAGQDPGRLGLIVSARVSGEMAQKAARAGTAWLASRSLATSLAVEIATAAGMPIVARAPGDAVVYGAAGVEERAS